MTSCAAPNCTRARTRETTHRYGLRQSCAVHAAEVLRATTWRERREIVERLARRIGMAAAKGE